MDTDPPEPNADPFGLVEQYDSIEDPDQRSDFLEYVGTTRPYIEALRLRRDRAAREAAARPEPDRVPPGRSNDRGARRRAPRLPIRNRTTTRPPGNASSARTRRHRNPTRPAFVVVVFKLG